MASGKWQKTTVIDLHIEREREAWYFKALAILAACLILLGYLVFAQALPSASTNASILTIVAAVFLTLGYLLSITLCFICKSLLFHLEVIFIPCLLSCIIGTLNLGITISIAGQPWKASTISAVALGMSSSIAYTGFTYLIYHRVDRIRGHDRKSTKKRESSEKLILVPEEELQRRNWSRLLVNKAENRSPQQTYRISIPDDVVALRTPPPLTAPLQSLGLSGTLKGPSSPYEGQIMSQNISNNALPSEDQCVFHQPFVVEAPISTQIATLEAARERARIAQARPNPPSPRNDDDTLPWPPVIVNTRNQYGENISQIPLSERHPLERVGHITGIASKDRKNIYSTSGVYRADEDYGGHDYDEEADANDYFDKPTFEIVKGQDIQVDLTKDYARQQPTILRSPNLLHNSPQQIHIQRLTSISPRQELHRKARESR